MKKIEYLKQFDYQDKSYIRLLKSSKTNLTPIQALLYSHMANDYYFFLNIRGMYKPSDNKLAEKLGVARGAVIRAREVLEQKGYIKVISKRKNCATIWHVNDMDNNGEVILSEPIITEAIKTVIGIGLEKDMESNTAATTRVCNELNAPEHQVIRITKEDSSLSDYELAKKEYGSLQEDEPPY